MTRGGCGHGVSGGHSGILKTAGVCVRSTRYVGLNLGCRGGVRGNEDLGTAAGKLPPCDPSLPIVAKLKK